MSSQSFMPFDCAGNTSAHHCRRSLVRHINVSIIRRIIVLACPSQNQGATQVPGLRGKMLKLTKQVVLEIIFTKRFARTFKHPSWPVIWHLQYSIIFFQSFVYFPDCRCAPSRWPKPPNEAIRVRWECPSYRNGWFNIISMF